MTALAERMQRGSPESANASARLGHYPAIRQWFRATPDRAPLNIRPALYKYFMSTNLSPAQYLTALVLNAPSARPQIRVGDVLCTPLGPYCALERARVAIEGDPGNLVEFARTLGFSRAEARGIIRGWDAACGKRMPYTNEAHAWPVDTARGEALGRQLHELVFAHDRRS